MTTYTKDDHTWVVCAYGESPYLEECLQSLAEQTVKSRILLVTSTPGETIDRAAERFGLEVRVNRGKAGISGDWNFALSQGKTALVTIAHQDDTYAPEYTEEMLRHVNQARKPLMYFTDYAELRDGRRIEKNRLLAVKRKLILPVRLFPGSRGARRLSLSLGNPVCCPSVTYIKTAIGGNPFADRFRSNLDWEMWERLSRKKGSFVYNPGRLMCHRVHEGSETSRLIGDHSRGQEDLEMFRRFWPERIARVLAKKYAAGEKSNGIRSNL